MIFIDDLLRYLQEDAPFGDVTSSALLQGIRCKATISTREEGIIAGLEEVMALYHHLDVTVTPRTRDGEKVMAGSPLLELEGSAEKILLAERTALNIIGRMSGIATKTRKLVEIVHAINPKCYIASTRKTSPGLRFLDKKAVILGGGESHRFSLSDMVLIKDNHLALVPLKEAISRTRLKCHHSKIEIEVSSPEQAVEAVRHSADIILLDNMDPATVTTTLQLLHEMGLRQNVIIEVSGGISEKNIRSFARLDVDVISIGGLTHSVTNLDTSLDIVAKI